MASPNYKQVDDMAAEKFAGHEINRQHQVATFRVGKPNTTNYGFFVTWRPGTLALSGDLGNITATHYQALMTLESTIEWMADAEFYYFMEKTGVDRVYDLGATVQDFKDFADEDAGWERARGDQSLWQRLMVHCSVTTHDDCLKRLKEATEHHYQAAMLAQDMEIDDYTGATKYADQCRWQWLALRHWAKEMVEGGVAT